MLSVHSTEIGQCDRNATLDWKISFEDLGPSLAESVVRVQKLAAQSAEGTGLEAKPVPNGRVSPGCSGADLPGLDAKMSLTRRGSIGR